MNEAKRPWVVEVPVTVVDANCPAPAVNVPVSVVEAAARPPVKFSLVPEAFEKESAPEMLRLVVVPEVNVALPP